jgi:outer membrane protein, heavy metal efflux system
MTSKTTLCSSLGLLLLWASAASGAPPLDQRVLEIKACGLAAERSVARAERALAAAEHAAAGVLPNPRLEAQHLRTLSGATDRETIVGVAVPFVVSGRTGLLREAAGARAHEADATVRARRFEAVVEARKLWTSAVLAQARYEVALRQQRALDDLAKAMAGLARGGEAARYDSLRQEVEARAHRQTVVRFQAQAAASRGALEAWLGQSVSLPALDSSGLLSPDARQRPPAEHPNLASLRASARASELSARAARRRAVPDPEIFAGYRQVDVESATGRGVAIGLTLPLVVFDRGQGDAERAQASALRARAQLEVEKRRLDAASRAELERLRVLELGLGAVEQSAKQAAELRDGARKLYAAGEISITELLDAFRSAESAELARLDTLEQLAVARIELSRATGSGLQRACEGSP